MLFPGSVVWVLLSLICELFGFLALWQVSDMGTFCTQDLFPVHAGTAQEVSVVREWEGEEGACD